MDRSFRIQAFVETIWDWYSQNKRTLPWRDLKDSDPAVRAYKVMVSEIMLQQTQVSRVKIVFKNFLERFKSIEDLARASNKDVLLAWRGMGYNSRALRLRDAAKVILNFQFPISNFPSSLEELRKIPGIGHYTAAAIRNFAFNIPTPCLDTNIRRILHRTFVGPENADGAWEKDDTYLLALAGELLDAAVASPGEKRDAANWHAALMDFGSIIQTKRHPRWDLCPLTAKKIMKTSPEAFARAENRKSQMANGKSLEPGRLVGTKYIPNRIFRGKVIEELRDAGEGLTLAMIGRNICIDWSPKAHQEWLRAITKKLVQERMVQVERGRYRLFEG